MGKVLKVMNLAEDNFTEFGSIITSKNKMPDAGDNNYSWYDKLGYFGGIEKISINILKAKKREMRIDKLEYHNKTPEAIIPLEGRKVVLVVAPAGELVESKIKAFYLNGGEGVILNKGVRHFIPYPIEDDADCLIVFRDATGANDLVFEQLSEVYEIAL